MKGGDVYVTGNIPNGTKPKAVVALKGADGKGGNVFVSKGANSIYATFYADGSVFSGEPGGTYYADSRS